MDLLQKIRNKPEPERKKILIITVTLFMVIVVYFWASRFESVSLGIGNFEQKTEVNNNEKFSPFEMISSKIFNISGAIENGIKNIGTEKKEIFKRENSL